jgi:hypothetical protein
MAKEREFYEGMPVFEAATSKKLKEAVENYRGHADEPYVVRIPKGRKAVKAGAFCNNDSVGVVLIPESVSLIGFEAFSLCENVRCVVIDGPVRSIGKSAFADCNSLTEINLPDTLTSIDYATFEGCTSLESIRIPNSVISISDAFNRCYSLKEIHIKKSELLGDLFSDKDIRIITD